MLPSDLFSAVEKKDSPHFCELASKCTKENPEFKKYLIGDASIAFILLVGTEDMISCIKTICGDSTASKSHYLYDQCSTLECPGPEKLRIILDRAPLNKLIELAGNADDGLVYSIYKSLFANDGWTPLYVITKYGTPEMLNILCSRIPPSRLSELANIKDMYEDTPLHLIVKRGSSEMLKIFCPPIPQYRLVELASLKMHEGWTLLHLIAHEGSPEMLNAFFSCLHPNRLVELANLEAYEGRTPLHLAIERGSPEILNIFCTRIPPRGLVELANLKSNSGWTPLHVMAMHGSPEMLNIFCRCIPRNMLSKLVRLKANNGWTPLHVAATAGTPEMLNAFFSCIPQDTIVELVGSEPSGNWTPLLMVAMFGTATKLDSFLSTVSLAKLAEEGGFKESDGWTPLHVAARHGSPEMLSVILSRIPLGKLAELAGFKDITGSTPLHLLLVNPNMNIDTLNSLLQICSLGAITQPNAQGKTAEIIAMENGKPEFAERIRSATNILLEEYRPLRELIDQEKFAEAYAFITKNRINPNTKINRSGSTILSYTLENYRREESPELVSFICAMMSLGADVNIPNFTGDPPLILAAEKNFIGATSSIYAHGADMTTHVVCSLYSTKLPQQMLERLLNPDESKYARDSTGGTVRPAPTM